LANIFCQTNGKSSENSKALIEISPALQKRIGINFEKLASISNQIGKWAKDFSENLSFDQ